MASRRSWLPIVLFAAALVAFAAALVVPGLETGVLFLSPAIVVLALLLTGHYVGEQQLNRLADAWQQRRPARERARREPLPRRPRALMPRGGRLVATSLAVRPPPLLQAVR
jgi:fatty acid desaturase